MAKLKVVYTEQDPTVVVYRNCDIEAQCRDWLDKLVECKDTSFVFVLYTAQELVFKTMQMLLIRDYKQLTTDDILFYIEEKQCLLDDQWRWIDYPTDYPEYQSKCLDIIWDL